MVRLTFHSFAVSSTSPMVETECRLGHAAQKGTRDSNSDRCPSPSPPCLPRPMASPCRPPSPSPTRSWRVPTAPTSPVSLTIPRQSKYKPAKIFKSVVDPPAPGPSATRTNNGPRHITGITFDDRGDQIVTAAEDETFRVWNCKTGKQVSYRNARGLFSSTFSEQSKHYTQESMA
jgi:WD40 repeat protein